MGHDFPETQTLPAAGAAPGAEAGTGVPPSTTDSLLPLLSPLPPAWLPVGHRAESDPHLHPRMVGWPLVKQAFRGRRAGFPEQKSQQEPQHQADSDLLGCPILWPQTPSDTPSSPPPREACLGGSQTPSPLEAPHSLLPAPPGPDREEAPGRRATVTAHPPNPHRSDCVLQVIEATPPPGSSQGHSPCRCSESPLSLAGRSGTHCWPREHGLCP